MSRGIRYRWHRLIGYARWRSFLRRTKHCRHCWHEMAQIVPDVQGMECCGCPRLVDHVATKKTAE